MGANVLINRRGAPVSLMLAMALVIGACGSREIKGNGESAAAPTTATANPLEGQPTPAAEQAPADGESEPQAAGTTSGAEAPPAPAASGGSSGGAAAPSQASGQKRPGASQAPASPSAPRSAVAAPGRSGQGGSSPVPAPNQPGQPAVPSGKCSKALAPIMIGTVGAQSGVVGQAVGGVARAVQAWAAATNATGGLNCHPVKHLIEDDGSDPNRHKALVQKLVEQDRVVAFVGQNADFSGFSSVDYINQKRVPVIVGDGHQPWAWDSPFFFPPMVGGPEIAAISFGSAALTLKPQGKTKVGMISCVEVPICAMADERAPAAASKYGLQLVYKGRGSITQPDYTSLCLSAQSAGAQILFGVVDGNTMHRIARSCSSVSYKPTYLSPVAGLQDDFRTDPNLDGAVGGFNLTPWFQRDKPAISEYQDALRRFTPDAPITTATVAGWTAAKLFEAAAKNIADPPTNEMVLRGLWSVKNNDLNGLTHPLSYTEGQNAPHVTCYWPVMVQGGKWVSPNKGERTCD
jgi:branched-chain amino acid transport system substrate-binding protein